MKNTTDEIIPIKVIGNVDISKTDVLTEEQKDFDGSVSYNFLSKLFRQEESIEDRIRSKLYQK